MVGHSPQRHGGHVDNPKLHDRSIPQPGTQYGVDPASGTTTDAFTGRPHRAQRTSTSFSSDNALVFAEDHIRNSQRLADEIAASVDGTATVDIPLKDIYGVSYKEHVRGLTRIGSARNPQGVEFTDFTDGTVKATYILENNKWNLITMFPQPKRP